MSWRERKGSWRFSEELRGTVLRNTLHAEPKWHRCDNALREWLKFCLNLLKRCWVLGVGAGCGAGLGSVWVLGVVQGVGAGCGCWVWVLGVVQNSNQSIRCSCVVVLPYFCRGPGAMCRREVLPEASDQEALPKRCSGKPEERATPGLPGPPESQAQVLLRRGR